MLEGFTIDRRSLLRLGGLAGLGALGVTACSRDSTDDQGTQTIDTLVVGVSSLDRQDFSPVTGQGQAEHGIAALIKDTLVGNDPVTKELVPGLALSWEASTDQRIWTFKLRPDVPFHNGKGTLDAEDVKFSWGLFIGPDSTFNSARFLRAAIDDDMDNFEIVGPLEFRLRTRGDPVFNLPNYICSLSTGLVIDSKAYWEADPEFAAKHPIGTGPFMFVNSTPGISVDLAAVEKHWRVTPSVKKVKLTLVDDDSARFAQVRSGQLDLGVVPPALALEAKNRGVKVVPVPEIGSMSVILGGQFPDDPARPTAYDRDSPWIQADSPEKGLAIRQAMSLAIDRQAIIDKVMAGQGSLIHAPIAEFPSNPNLVDPSWELPAYDVDKAKAKLAEGGYPDGFEVKMMVYENRPGAGGAAVAEAVAGMWEAIGLTVIRQPTDQTTFRPVLRERTSAGMAWTYITPFYAEAVQAFSANFTPQSTAGLFYDEDIPAAMAALQSEPDQMKRYAITRELLNGLILRMRAIPLFTVSQTYAASSRVGDWKPLAGNSELSSLESVTPAG